MASLINTISSGEISGKIAKNVFEIMVKTGEEPIKIIKEKGLKQQSDPKELEKIVIKVLETNSNKVSEYKKGKEKTLWIFYWRNNESFLWKSQSKISK